MYLTGTKGNEITLLKNLLGSFVGPYMLKQGLDSGLITELSDMLCHSLQTGFTPQSPL